MNNHADRLDNLIKYNKFKYKIYNYVGKIGVAHNFIDDFDIGINQLLWFKLAIMAGANGGWSTTPKIYPESQTITESWAEHHIVFPYSATGWKEASNGKSFTSISISKTGYIIHNDVSFSPSKVMIIYSEK